MGMSEINEELTKRIEVGIFIFLNKTSKVLIGNVFLYRSGRTTKIKCQKIVKNVTF